MKRVQTGKTVYQKRKVCRFCADETLPISYRDYTFLRHFVTERGKIIPRRISGNCAKHQRKVTNAVKRARIMSILPFVSTTV